MTVNIVSFPQVAEGLLPLQLPEPNAINSCGYLLPVGGGSSYAYSPLDLLVAGLEAGLMGFFVFDLTKFFNNRAHIRAEGLVYFTVSIDGQIVHDSVLGFKARVFIKKESELLRVLKRNAPWTFKGVSL